MKKGPGRPAPAALKSLPAGGCRRWRRGGGGRRCRARWRRAAEGGAEGGGNAEWRGRRRGGAEGGAEVAGAAAGGDEDGRRRGSNFRQPGGAQIARVGLRCRGCWLRPRRGGFIPTPLLSRVVARPATKGPPFIAGRATTRDKRGDLLSRVVARPATKGGWGRSAASASNGSGRLNPTAWSRWTRISPISDISLRPLFCFK